MIAVDTNLLIHAHRAESPWHDRAAPLIEQLAKGPWLIPWPCLHEFMAITTNPRIFAPPTPTAIAIEQVEIWRDSPGLGFIGEMSSHWSILRELIESAQITGPRIHDARIAAICIENGVDELWTADRDFSRFPQLRTRNPLITM